MPAETPKEFMIKMKFKIAAVAVAIAMIAGAVFVMAPDSGSADAAPPTWKICVNQNNAWTVYSGSGYNGCIAASNANIPGLVIDTDYTVTKSNAWGSYTTINDRYGLVTGIGGVANTATDVWNTAVYTGGGWHDQRNPVANPSDPDDGIDSSQAALGFYKPYSDYNAEWRTGTVALWFGAETSSMPTGLSVTAAPIVNVTASSDYAVSFIVAIENGYTATVSPGGNQITPMYSFLWSFAQSVIYGGNNMPMPNPSTASIVTGYGSDAYLALKNALGSSNVSGNDTPGEYYGWISTIYGLGTVQTAGQNTPDDYSDDKYIYWNQFDGIDSSTYQATYSGFLTGAHSPVQGAPMNSYFFLMHYKADI